MYFSDHKDRGNHLLQLRPKVVKHPVYIYVSLSNLMNCGYWMRNSRDQSVCKSTAFLGMKCVSDYEQYRPTGNVLRK